MQPIILENITHNYNTVPVLDQISVAFEENLITALIGKSGSGKSTLLQLINGLLRPAEGQVRIFGEALNYDDIVPTRLKIAYAVQGTGLFPHLSVSDNISLLARLNKWSAEAIDKRVRHLLDLVELSMAMLEKYPHQISGGEQQRVGLCRAMMLNPPVFLLDEAFGALDPETRNEIHREFINLQKAEPRTIIMVTHDLREACKLADRMVMLDDGKIAQQGAVDEFRKMPASEHVRRFFAGQLEDEW